MIDHERSAAHRWPVPDFSSPGVVAVGVLVALAFLGDRAQLPDESISALLVVD